MMATLHRSDVEQILANDKALDLSAKEVHAVLDRLFVIGKGGIIPAAIRDGGKVVIPGFGTFHSTVVLERTIKHPRTQEDVVIPHRRYPRWSASTLLKMVCRARCE